MSAEAGLSFTFLAEPVLALRPDGGIVAANPAALRLFGAETVGRLLSDLATDPPDEVASLLRRASGTSAPQIAALTFHATGGGRTRLHAARLLGPEEPRIVLRLLPDHATGFELLSRRVRELDAQLRLRLEEKAVLEAALQDNEALLEELQHRVKNNIQMMMTLIRLPARGHAGPEVAALVATAERRLQAMAASQEALYRSRRPGAVAAGPMLGEILAKFRQVSAAPVLADIGAAQIPSDQAHCLTLIFDEFLAAVDAAGGVSPLRVVFRRDPDGLLLSVGRDVPAARPAEGVADLALLRPLARQMCGEVEVEAGRRLRYRLVVPARGITA